MDYYVAVAIQTALHVLLGLSAYVILMTGQLSFGQQGFFAIGAYLSAIATAVWGWGLAPALALGAAAAAVVAVGVGVPTLRLRGIYFSVGTFAFGEMVRLLLLNLRYQTMDPELGRLVGPDRAEGFRHIRYLLRHGWTATEYLGLVLAVLAVVLAGFWLLEHSRLGILFRAVEEDDLAAGMVGIDVTALKVLAFAISGAIGGLGGGLFAHHTTFVSHELFGLGMSVEAVAYPMIGGLATFWGPVAGATFLIFLTEWLRFLHDYRMVVYGGLIVLTMAFRPRGLFDERLLRRLRAAFPAGRPRLAVGG